MQNTVVPFRRAGNHPRPNTSPPPLHPLSLKELCQPWWTVPLFIVVAVTMFGLFAWLWIEERLWPQRHRVATTAPVPTRGEEFHTRTLRLVKGARPRTRRAGVEDDDTLPPAA